MPAADAADTAQIVDIIIFTLKTTHTKKGLCVLQQLHAHKCPAQTRFSRGNTLLKFIFMHVCVCVYVVVCVCVVFFYCLCTPAWR